MKINVKNILTGAFNSVFVKEEIERVAKEREKVCELCEYYSGNHPRSTWSRPDIHCRNCGCNLHMKTRVLSEQCPMKKWLAEVTDEEDDKIQEMLKNENQD